MDIQIINDGLWPTKKRLWFNFGFLCGVIHHHGFWVRFCGLGIRGKDIREWPLMFSERAGMHKLFQVKFWSFRILSRI
jgi:hypothetical protein